MNAETTALLRCPTCQARFAIEEQLRCLGCGARYPIRDGIARFISSQTHENFAIQWKKFSDVQLDSRNGISDSRDRLLFQSELKPEDFREKTVLEVGCGAGRFTEILLALGAKVVAVDYSAAVEACAASNRAAREEGRLWNAQADAFALPFQRRAFDIVVGYGMLQHTGDAHRALLSLWEHVRPGGLLLVDRYQLSLRSAHPIKYLVRPVLKRLPAMMVLSLAEWTCRTLIPLQKRVLRWTKGRGLRRYLGYLVARSPNSVYPLNLELAGRLDSETAFRWSVMDTFDMWAPRYDCPQTLSGWRADLASLDGGEVLACKSGGQGNVGVVRRRS